MIMGAGLTIALTQTYMDAEIVPGSRLNLVLGPNGQYFTSPTIPYRSQECCCLLLVPAALVISNIPPMVCGQVLGRVPW